MSSIKLCKRVRCINRFRCGAFKRKLEVTWPRPRLSIICYLSLSRLSKRGVSSLRPRPSLLKLTKTMTCMGDCVRPTPNDIQAVERELREVQKKREQLLRLCDDPKRRKTEQSGEMGLGGDSFREQA